MQHKGICLMSEKLTDSITFKCTYEEKRNLEAIAKSESRTLSEHMRGLGISNILEVTERLNNLASLMRLTTDTTVTPQFELSPDPILKPQAQKKPNCCNQLSLIAIHNQSYK